MKTAHHSSSCRADKGRDLQCPEPFPSWKTAPSPPSLGSRTHTPPRLVLPMLGTRCQLKPRASAGMQQHRRTSLRGRAALPWCQLPMPPAQLITARLLLRPRQRFLQSCLFPNPNTPTQ